MRKPRAEPTFEPSDTLPSAIREWLRREPAIARGVPARQLVIVPDARPGAPPEDSPPARGAAPQRGDAADPVDEGAPPQRHEISCISYTSGTTGPSKGVLVPWGRFW